MKNGKIFVFFMLAIMSTGCSFTPSWTITVYSWIVSLVKGQILPSPDDLIIYSFSTAITIAWCMVGEKFRPIPAKLGGGILPGLAFFLLIPAIFLVPLELAIFGFKALPKYIMIGVGVVLGILTAWQIVASFRKGDTFLIKRIKDLFGSIVKLLGFSLDIAKGNKNSSAPGLYALSGAIFWSMIINLQFWNKLTGFRYSGLIFTSIIGGIVFALIITGHTFRWLKNRPKDEKVGMVKCLNPHCPHKWIPATQARCLCGWVNEECPIHCVECELEDLPPDTQQCPTGCDPANLYRGKIQVFPPSITPPPRAKTVAKKTPAKKTVAKKTPAKKPAKKTPAKKTSPLDWKEKTRESKPEFEDDLFRFRTRL